MVFGVQVTFSSPCSIVLNPALIYIYNTSKYVCVCVCIYSIYNMYSMQSPCPTPVLDLSVEIDMCFRCQGVHPFGISFAQVDGLDVLDGLDGLEWCDLEWNL